MKKDLLTVKELAAELRMSPKSIQRACVVVSEKRANGRTSEMVCLVCVVESEKRGTRGTGETWEMVYLVCLVYSVCLVSRTGKPT